MDELSELTVYSDTELSMMYVKLLQGDESVINKICNSFMKRVVDIAGEYRNYGIEDVIQEGNMALYMELVKLCGCKEPVDVEEALDMAVREGISNYISEIAGENDIEQTVIGKVNLINEAIKLLKLEKGEEPSVSELASYTGLSEDELTDIMEIIKKADKR
jgi:RNA polymerase primary sigma factor